MLIIFLKLLISCTLILHKYFNLYKSLYTTFYLKSQTPYLLACVFICKCLFIYLFVCECFVGDLLSYRINWYAPAVKPAKGDALLFFSLHPDATTDTSSLHGSCPVIEGEKWSATKWIHVRSFEKIERSSDTCADENELCALWASAGECEKNPNYMVGSNAAVGFCRKSCNACSSQEIK